MSYKYRNERSHKYRNERNNNINNSLYAILSNRIAQINKLKHSLNIFGCLGDKQDFAL